MNQPIKHHYVPQFYLAGFTQAGLKNADLHVFDQSLGRSWRSTPKGAGFKKNFHRIANSTNGDEMAIEKKLADFEGRWAVVLKEMIDSKQLPEGDAFEELMMFVAFMAARVPSIRNKISEFMSDIHRSMLQLWCASDAGKASLRQTIESSGTTMDDDEFAKLLDFGRSGDYEISIEQTFCIKQIFEIAIPLTGMLSKRHWQLWSIAGEAPDMICSDCPVAASWIIPAQSQLLSPGFGVEQTIVSVPLHRRLALVGVFEEGLPESKLDAKGVAAINSMTGCHANQIYSSESDFIWMTRQHEIGNATDLLRQLQESK